MKKISVVMAVYNAANTIRKTLDSLSWADEVLVMDSESTDATNKICREHPNCKVVQSFPNDINLKRNQGYKKAFGDWILNLDADEIVPPELAREIKNILSSDNNVYDGYFAANREFMFGKWLYYINGQKYRAQRYFLFRQGCLRWPGIRTHEMPIIKGKWGCLKNAFDHEPHNVSVASFITKINNYSGSDMAKITLEQARERFRWHRMLFLPVKQFLIMYIKHQGFRDGAAGLVLSILSSFNVFLEYAKLWELIYVKRKL